MFMYLMWTQAIHTHPLSTFSIFGFCFTSQLGALLVQTAYWTPVSLNLRQPITTFAVLAMFQVIAMCAHALYRMFDRNSVVRPKHTPSAVRALLKRMGIYKTPTIGTVWIMGFVGVFAQLFGGGFEAGISGKILQGIAFLAWMPFLIPMFILNVGATYCNTRKNYIFLLLYICLIALLAIAANARGMMLSGIMTIALFMLLSSLRNQSPVRAARLLQITIVCALFAALTVPISDVATAMVLARSIRKTSSPIKMVEETFYYLQQPALLKKQRDNDNFSNFQSSYDESYFASPLIARLIETKFHDNALYFGDRLSDRDRDRVIDTTIDLFWTNLPDPMLKGLDIKLNKANFRFSLGDYLSHLAGAGELGGYKVGSSFAQGFALAGYFYPLIYFFICPLLFLSHDLFLYLGSSDRIEISPLGMISIWNLFLYGITADNVQVIVMGILRGLPQNIIIYLIIFYFARWIASVLAAITGFNHRHITPEQLA